MSYSVKILSNEEFERLPYKHASIALGVADPENNTAYVRHSAHPELQKYLIDHEFEHLIEDHPTDEIEGVRYKIPFAAALPAIGGALKTGASALATKALPAIGGGLAKAGGAITGGVKGAGSMIGKGASGLMNMFGGGGSGPILQNSKLSNQNMMNFGGKPTGGGPSGPGGPSGGNSGGGGGFNPMSLFGGGDSKMNNILGVASLATGLMKNFPKAPELPASVGNLRSQIQSGGSPLGQFGSQKLQGLMNQEFDPLSQPEIDASLRQLEIDQKKSEDQVRDLYRNLRPGTDPSSDATFRRDLQEVQDQFARAKADTVATRTRDVKGIFDQQRMQQIQTSLGASQSEMSQLAQLAQMDVEQIMKQLEMDYNQALLFKQTFLNLGTSFIEPESPFEKFLSSRG